MEVEVYKRWDEENQKHWWFEGRKKIIYSINLAN